MAHNPSYNPSLNAPGIHQWPAHEQRIFRSTIEKNRKEENALTTEQREQYGKMAFYFAERYAKYTGETNYPDPLCEALACRDAITAVTRKPQK